MVVQLFSFPKLSWWCLVVDGGRRIGFGCQSWTKVLNTPCSCAIYFPTPQVSSTFYCRMHLGLLVHVSLDCHCHSRHATAEELRATHCRQLLCLSGELMLRLNHPSLQVQVFCLLVARRTVLHIALAIRGLGEDVQSRFLFIYMCPHK